MLFTITEKDKSTKARNGYLNLPHGRVETPVFMPVGTNGTVKALTHDALDEMNFRIILGNTYHLYLRPGTEVISEFGSLHDFSTWKHNILTDSGGYQVFSLAPFRKIKEEGVYFRSHIDGSYHTLTPENVVQTQQIFRSDIMMPLDVCTPPAITEKEALDALKLTTRWAKRSKNQWLVHDEDYNGVLFGIIQGNFFKNLRSQSAEELIELDLPGIAIGGLSVGESYEKFTEYLEYTAALLPENKPRYLMGIGTPEYILDAVENGIDLFDCVFPTRIARNGSVFTRDGIIALKKEQHRLDKDPIDESCRCYTCRRYSRGYMRHLFKAREILGPMLASRHNLHFLQNLIMEIRISITQGRFADYKKSFLERYVRNNNG